MKVDNPRFHTDDVDAALFPGGVHCPDCPFEESDFLCDTEDCPTAETYAAACALAEAAEKEGR